MADNLTLKEEFLLNPVTEHNITDAAVASFETNLRHPLKVEIPITPVQDLHGYNYPWPNATVLSGNCENATKTVGDATIVSENGTFTLSGTLAQGEALSFELLEPFTLPDNINRVSIHFNNNIAGSSQLYLYTMYSDGTKTAISPLVSVNRIFNFSTSSSQSSYIGKTVVGFQFYAKDTVSLDGVTMSPQYILEANICPIEGWTKTEIKHRGKNLFDINAAKISKNWDNGLYQTFLPTVSMKPGLKITVSYSGEKIVASNPAIAVHISPDRHKAQGPFLIHNYNSYVETSRTVTLASNGEFYLDAYKPASAINLLIDREMQIEIGSVRTTYEAYRGNQISVDWEDEAGIVYGGTITLNEDGSADVKNDRLFVVLDGSSDEDWSEGGYGASIKWGAPSNLYKKIVNPTSAYQPYNAIANYLRPIAQAANWNTNDNYFSHTGQYIYMKCSTIGAFANWRSYLSENPLTILFKLKNPETYHFANVGQLKAFLGTNNVWSDIGNVNVKYLTQNSETGMEYRGDRALELRRRAMLADAPTIHTTVGSEATGGLASFKSYVKAPVKKIEIPFTPKQDLHGMANPYPAGASVNLIPDTTDTENGYVAGHYLKSDGSTGANANYYISEYIELDSTTTYTWSNRINTSISPSICFYDENKTFISGIAINKQYSHTFTPPEGAVYARSSQVTYAYQEAASTNPAFQLEVGSTATTYRRYSNSCPIEGFGHTNIGNRGKNFFDFSKWDTIAKINNAYGSSYHAVNVPVPNGVYTVHSKYFNDNNKHGFYANIAGDYAHRASSSPGSISYWMHHDSSSAYRHNTVVINVTGGNLYINIYQANANTITWLSGLQVEAGSVATDYVPYRKPDTVPIIFSDPSTGDPITVYGGTVTLNEDGSADLVRKYGLKTISASDNIGGNAPNGYMSMSSAGMSSGHHYWNVNAKCNIMKKIDGNYPGQPGIRIGAGDKTVYFYRMNEIDATLTTTAAIKAWLIENGCCFTFPLATPTTYHFSNLEQLRVWLGENNFWCDISDDITVKYWNRG